MNKFFLQLILSCMLFLGACKKNNIHVADNTATLHVVNGIIEKNIQLKINGSISNSGANSTNNNQYRIFYGSNMFYYAEAKSTPVSILDFTDSSTLVSQDIDLKKGRIYTMLLAGIAPSVETVLIDDSNMPFVDQSVIPSNADSVINIRFINLCPDAQPIDIRLTGSSTNEVTGLAYKGYTAFKSYPAKATDFAGTIGYSVLSFDFVQNGSVLKDYSIFVYFPNRFKNLALVVTGMKKPGSGQPPLDVSEMDYFQ